MIGSDRIEEQILEGEESHLKVAKLLQQFGFFKFESDIDMNVLMDVLDKDKDGKFSLDDFKNSFQVFDEQNSEILEND